MVLQSEARDGHITFGGFLNRNSTSIQSPGHESGLIGILQLAAEHPDGIVAALGHNNCATWVRNNIDAIFRGDGRSWDFYLYLLRFFSVILEQPKD